MKNKTSLFTFSHFSFLILFCFVQAQVLGHGPGWEENGTLKHDYTPNQPHTHPSSSGMFKFSVKLRPKRTVTIAISCLHKDLTKT